MNTENNKDSNQDGYGGKLTTESTGNPGIGKLVAENFFLRAKLTSLAQEYNAQNKILELFKIDFNKISKIINGKKPVKAKRKFKRIRNIKSNLTVECQQSMNGFHDFDIDLSGPQLIMTCKYCNKIV